MILFQWLFAPLLLGLAALHAVRLLRRRVRRSRGLLWTLVWGTSGLIVLYPELSQHFARLFGIGRGSDLILYLALIAGLLVAFTQYQQYRRLEIMVTELIRHLALEHPERGGQRRTDPEPDR
jgi:small membrane protein